MFISLRFFIRCFSHLRSLRVSPVARFFLAADQQTEKSRRVDDPATTLARLPTHIRLKSWAYMVNDRLLPAVALCEAIGRPLKPWRGRNQRPAFPAPSGNSWQDSDACAAGNAEVCLLNRNAPP